MHYPFRERMEKLIPLLHPSLCSKKILAFEMIPDKAVQQANAIAGSPCLAVFVCWRTHGRSGNVEMRPRGLTDKALEELCRRDRSAVTASAVLHIGEFRIDHLVVFGAERQAPQLFTRR